MNQERINLSGFILKPAVRFEAIAVLVEHALLGQKQVLSITDAPIYNPLYITPVQPSLSSYALSSQWGKPPMNTPKYKAPHLAT